MYQILATVVGAIMGGLGALVRRFLERDSLAMVIDRRLRLVSLYQRMRAAGLTESDLIQLEQDLTSDESPANRADSTPDLCVRHDLINHTEL